MWKLQILCVLYFIGMLCTYTSPRPHSDKEAMAEEIVRIKDVKCPDCYPSTFDGTVCGSDGKTYQNMGIFMCVNKCKKGLKVVSMDRCPEFDELEDKSTTPLPADW